MPPTITRSRPGVPGQAGCMKKATAIIYTKKDTTRPASAHIFLKGGGKRRIDYIDFDSMLNLFEAQEFLMNHIARTGLFLQEIKIIFLQTDTRAARRQALEDKAKINRSIYDRPNA
jgi:hypothetical protein